MDGAPVRFFLSLHYTTFVNHEWVSDASMRASGVSSFFLASLFLQAVIRSRGNTEKLRHAPRQVPIDIESRAFFFLSRSKGRRSLSLSFSATLIIGKVIIENKWKSRIDDTRGNLHRVKPCKIRGKRIKLNRAMIEAFETVILIFQTRLEERRNYEGETRLSMWKNLKNLILIWIRSLPTRFSNSQRGIGIRSSAAWLYISRRRTCTSSKKRYNPIRNSNGGRKRKITGRRDGRKDGGTREEHPLDRLASIPQSGPADRSKPSTNAEHHRHYYYTTLLVPCTTRSANYEMDPGVTRPINLPTKFVPTFRSERERERWSYFLLDEKRTAATCTSSLSRLSMLVTSNTRSIYRSEGGK